MYMMSLKLLCLRWTGGMCGGRSGHLESPEGWNETREEKKKSESNEHIDE